MQGGLPSYQQNGLQGGPPSYQQNGADCPVHHLSYAGQSAQCIMYAMQGGPPSFQQNSAQGGPPCVAYLLRRVVRPPNSKMVGRADRPVHHIYYAGRSALLAAKWHAGRTALCII